MNILKIFINKVLMHTINREHIVDISFSRQEAKLKTEVKDKKGDFMFIPVYIEQVEFIAGSPFAIRMSHDNYCNLINLWDTDQDELYIPEFQPIKIGEKDDRTDKSKRTHKRNKSKNV